MLPEHMQIFSSTKDISHATDVEKWFKYKRKMHKPHTHIYYIYMCVWYTGFIVISCVAENCTVYCRYSSSDGNLLSYITDEQ